MFRNSPTAYGSLTKFFHWVTVFLVAFQFISISIYRGLREEPTDLTWTVLNQHKTSGFLIMMLVMMRIIWRRMSPLPDWPANFGEWDKKVTHLGEYGLYGAMLLMSVSGMGIELFGGHYIPLFDFAHIDSRSPFWHMGAVSYAADDVAARQALAIPNLRDALIGLHVVAAFVTVAFLSIHLTHVMRHAFDKRNGILQRMLPSGAPNAEG